MFPAGPSDGYHARQPSSGAPGSNPTNGDLRVDTSTRSRRKSSRIWSSVARAFLQRTMACLKRQPKQASQHDSTSLSGRSLTMDQGNLPLSDAPRLIGHTVFPSSTRLVLKGTDDVSFSPSSFFPPLQTSLPLLPTSHTPLPPPPPFP